MVSSSGLYCWSKTKIIFELVSTPRISFVLDESHVQQIPQRKKILLKNPNNIFIV